MMNSESKDLFLSKTFWGTLLLLLSMILQTRGIEIDAAGWTNDIMGLIGAALAIVGRVKANAQISSVLGIKTGGGA